MAGVISHTSQTSSPGLPCDRIALHTCVTRICERSDRLRWWLSETLHLSSISMLTSCHCEDVSILLLDLCASRGLQRGRRFSLVFHSSISCTSDGAGMLWLWSDQLSTQAARLSLPLHTRKRHAKHISMLEVYFLLFHMCNYGNCILGSVHCRNVGDLHSKLCLNTPWAYSGEGGLKLLLLC